MRYVVIVTLALVVGCKNDKEASDKLPDDPCKRIAHCNIDESCGGSLLGEKVHKHCGKEASCEAVAACIVKDLDKEIQGAYAAKNIGTLHRALYPCGHVFDYVGPLPEVPDLRRVCETGFKHLEGLVGQAKDEKLQFRGCRSLDYAGKALGKDFVARAVKVCPKYHNP